MAYVTQEKLSGVWTTVDTQATEAASIAYIQGRLEEPPIAWNPGGCWHWVNLEAPSGVDNSVCTCCPDLLRLVKDGNQIAKFEHVDGVLTVKAWLAFP